MDVSPANIDISTSYMAHDGSSAKPQEQRFESLQSFWQGQVGVMCYQIVLADNHPLIRKCIREILAETKDLEVVAEADDGQALLDLLSAHL